VQATHRPKALAPIEIGLLRRWRAKRRPPPTQKVLFQVGVGRPPARGPWRPIEIGLSRRSAPGVGLRRRKERFPGRRRRLTGRRPWCRLKSAFKGAPRQASASADAKGAFPGRRRPTHRPEAPGGRIHSACRPTVGRRPLTPIEIGLQRRSAPSVGLRRRKKCFSRSAQATHRPKAFDAD
jgi:hypothetical protein